MDPQFEEIQTHPENEIFRVVFFPDRIYHARYLSATRSPRYRYDVDEVRNGPDITAMKGSVYLDGARLCSVLRIEYRAGRMVELVRERGRRLECVPHLDREGVDQRVEVQRHDRVDGQRRVLRQDAHPGLDGVTQPPAALTDQLDHPAGAVLDAQHAAQPRPVEVHAALHCGDIRPVAHLVHVVR